MADGESIHSQIWLNGSGCKMPLYYQTVSPNQTRSLCCSGYCSSSNASGYRTRAAVGQWCGQESEIWAWIWPGIKATAATAFSDHWLLWSHHALFYFLCLLSRSTGSWNGLRSPYLTSNTQWSVTRFCFSYNLFLLFKISGPTCTSIITKRALKSGALYRGCNVIYWVLQPLYSS